MPEISAEELREIIARDGPSGMTRDRKLLGAIVTSPDYMVTGMFLPTDPEQAEKALIDGGEIVLWRTRPFAPEEEIRLRDMWHRISIQKQMSINECFVAAIPEAITAKMQPHEILR
jgi:hypothetical protein